MDLDPYLTTNVLETFTEILGIRNNHVDVSVVVLAVVGVGVMVPEQLWACVLLYLWLFILLSLLRVHVRCMPLIRPPLMCSSSLCSI